MDVFLAIVITALVVALLVWIIANAYRTNVYEKKIGSAEEKAREIIDEALKTAETKKREALLEAKEESLKAKNEIDKETKERRAELQRFEKRVLSKEEALDKKAEPNTAFSASKLFGVFLSAILSLPLLILLIAPLFLLQLFYVSLI